jgi:hypothetical protein
MNVSEQQKGPNISSSSTVATTSPCPPLPIPALPMPSQSQQPSQRFLFLENSSGSEDELQLQNQNPQPQNVFDLQSPAGGGKILDQLKFTRSKYRNFFHMDEQNSVYCKLCPFMLTASSSNQTYQKIRNHIRYNHKPWNLTN